MGIAHRCERGCKSDLTISRLLMQGIDSLFFICVSDLAYSFMIEILANNGPRCGGNGGELVVVPGEIHDSRSLSDDHIENFSFPRCEEPKNVEKGNRDPFPSLHYYNQIRRCFYQPTEHVSVRNTNYHTQPGSTMNWFWMQRGVRPHAIGPGDRRISR
jgi:hypothetical protein